MKSTQRIAKMANYVHRNGSDFEEMMKAKEVANPKFAFLFGGENAQYYRLGHRLSHTSPLIRSVFCEKLYRRLGENNLAL
jgi:hypothetical protein